MISIALDFLKEEVEKYLTLVNNDIIGGDGFIVLSNVADQEGKWAIPADKLGMSLINVEEEKILKDQEYTYTNGVGDLEKRNPAIKLNLYVLFSANYVNNTGDSSHYVEGLKQLSNVVSFFQGKNVFNKQNAPLLDEKIEKLIVELFSIPIEQQNYLWTYVGAKYIPSVVYKIRLVSVQDKQSLEALSIIESMAINTSTI